MLEMFEWPLVGRRAPAAAECRPTDRRAAQTDRILVERALTLAKGDADAAMVRADRAPSADVAQRRRAEHAV